MSKAGKKPWLWPVIALGSGLVTGFISWMLFPDLNWRFYFLAGLGVGLLVMALNPALRYFRLAASILASFNLLSSLYFESEGVIFGQTYSVSSTGLTTGVSIALILLVALLLVLDYMKRNGKGLPFLSLTVKQGDTTHIANQTNVGGDHVDQEATQIKEISAQRDVNITVNNSQEFPPIPKDLTHLVPRRLLSTTTGRIKHLAELRSMLLAGQQVAVVNGMGGIGKSTLAEVYVEEFYSEYQHIAWLTQNKEDFKLDLAGDHDLAQSLGVNPENQDPEALFREVIRRMKALPGPCLLVVDNALPTLEQLLRSLPKGPEWHLLVTTRSELSDVPLLRLDLLEPKNALSLFQNICSLPYDETRLESLLKTIEYHTLTVELLAKTAKNRRLTIDQLEAVLISDQASKAAVAHSQKQPVERIGSYLSQVFALSDLSEDEQQLMKYWACLPALPIAYATLEELIDPQAIGLADRLGQLLNGLVGKGLLQRDDEKDTYKVHALISDIAWQDLQPQEEEVLPLVQNLARALEIDQTKDNPLDKFIWEPYGRKVCDRFTHSSSASISYLQNNLAWVLKELGDYAKARALLEKAVASDEKNFGEDHLETTVSYSNLALVLKDLGDYQGAKSLFEKAVTSAEKIHGIDHHDTAVSYSNLATVLQVLGNYTRAKSLLEKAVASTEKKLGHDHPSTSIHYSNLGDVLRDLGDYSRARHFLERAMASDEKNFGHNHPTTAIRYTNLAVVLQDLGDNAEAKSLLEQAMA